MTAHLLHNSGKNEPAILLLIFGMALLVLLAGKELIAWLLMKLYQFFIEQNPLN